ncbi:MAG: hypothetical protein Q7U53_17965 [Anaerolineaceae bacterium]|nr:hypothetical protein [Anaerolineaceae bacterium]
MKSIQFQNQASVIIENKQLQLTISRSIGPRILGLNFHGKPNLLAELPDFTTELPDGNSYHFYGGHRLWVAPENIPLTYELDDQPVEIIPDKDTILILKEIELQSGVEKSIRVKLDPDKPVVTLEHVLKNCGNEPLIGAPWAITQFKTGGIAILPQSKKDTGLLPNRSLVLWPYSDMTTPKVHWGNDYILLDASVEAPFKFGFPNPRGWLAYWLDGNLFVKRAMYDPTVLYYDQDSSTECYCNARFIELETLGPITTIACGESVSHIETWELYADIERPRDEADVAKMVARLGIE